MTIKDIVLNLAGFSEDEDADIIGCKLGALKAIGEELFPDDIEEVELNECSYWDAKLILRALKLGMKLPSDYEGLEKKFNFDHIVNILWDVMETIEKSFKQNKRRDEVIEDYEKVHAFSLLKENKLWPACEVLIKEVLAKYEKNVD